MRKSELKFETVEKKYAIPFKLTLILAIFLEL